MTRTRRATLYLAALAGFLLLLAGLTIAAWRSTPAAGDTAARSTGLISLLSPWLLLGVAGLVVWAGTWLAANRVARPLTMTGAAERASEPRKAYLALAQLAALLLAAALLWRALRSVALRFLGDDLAGWPGSLVVLAAAGGLALLLWGYLEWESSRDENEGAEPNVAARWRRGYVYATIAAGSAISIAGVAELLRAGIRLGLRPLAADISWHAPAAGAIAALFVGVVLGSLGWGVASRRLARASIIEANSLSRVLLRHGLVLITSLMTLVAIYYLAEQAILRAVQRAGVEAGSRALFGIFDWTWALAYLPVAAVAWGRAARGVRGDAEVGGETGRTASIRRLVRYTVALMGLAAFWYGLVEFSRLILQVLLGVGDFGGAVAARWLERFARAAALVLVGAPAWWGHWWSQQVRARIPGPEGRAERASAIRRAYLLAIILMAVALVVAAAGFGTFLAINWQAAGGLGGVRAAVAGAGAAAIVSAFWALTHGLTLRRDTMWLAAEAAEAVPSHGGVQAVPAATRVPVPEPVVEAQAVVPPAQAESEVVGPRRYSREGLVAMAAAGGAAVEVAGRPGHTSRPELAVVDGADGSLGAALIRALRKDMPQVRIWPIALTDEAEVAMLTALGEAAPNSLPPNVLASAAVILAPSDSLAGGNPVAAELADAIASSSARVLMLPPRDGRFRWVAAPDWPLSRWIENALIEVRNALES